MPPGSANRAGAPKGQATANMVLATFAETTVARSPGRNPAITKTPWGKYCDQSLRMGVTLLSLEYVWLFPKIR